MASRAVPAPLAQLPNAITVLRLAAIPIFVLLMLEADGGHSWPAGIVFGLAGISDRVDGVLARRWRVESQFGRVADPLADRLMIDSAVVLLWLDDRLPWAALVLIVVRDVVLIAGYRVLEPRGYELDVSLLGKVATGILYASLGFTILTPEHTDWPLWLFWAGLGLALAAGAGYVASALQTVRKRA